MGNQLHHYFKKIKPGLNSKLLRHPALFLVIVFILLTSVIFKSYLSSNSGVKTSTHQPLASSSSSAREKVDLTVSTKFQKDKLEKYLTVEAALLGVSDNISLYFYDLNQKADISIDPSKSWIPASTIKSFVVLEAFRQRRLGLIDFNQTVTIKAANVVPTELETGEFPRLREGTRATIKQLVEAMVIQSDNTAYNTLIDLLDRRNINDYLKSLGLTETVVGEKLNLDNGQFQADLQAPGRQPNTTTVKDLATLFQLLYNNQIPDSQEIMAIFKRQKINNMLPALLPDKTVVAHKTGDWAPIYHDGGVVYKPSDPFILAVFTNSNDPSVLAKLAQVAYYQTADVVGKNLSKSSTANQTISSTTEYTLAASEQDKNVLGVSIQDAKFPEITAADLGITASDLSVDQVVAQNVPTALISPDSILYKAKLLLENIELSAAKAEGQGTQAYLSQSQNRLSEAKAQAKRGNLNEVTSLINQSESNLNQAATLASNDKSSNLGLIQTKQANDLQFATLAEIAQNVSPSEKEQFVDMVYNLYQKNQQQIIPKVQSPKVGNPLNQKPIIATVQSISGNRATIKLDDGTTKEVLINDNTPVRAFEQTNVQTPSSIANGSKIAIVGQISSDGKVVPQFILSNVPKELPAEHTGIVVAASPQKNTLTVQDQFGQKAEIQVDSDTVLKGRDTAVSVGGIKTGSVVSIFGQIENSSPKSATPSSAISRTPSISLTPGVSGSSTSPAANASNPSSSSTKPETVSTAPSLNKVQAPSSAPTGSTGVTSAPATSGSNKTVNVQNNQGSVTTIKATTVTVIKNGSGTNEVSKPQPAAPAPKPANNPAPPPANNPPANPASDNMKPAEPKAEPKKK